MFERDYDETKIWINEKLKAASDYEGYLVRVINSCFRDRLVSELFLFHKYKLLFEMFTCIKCKILVL